MRLCDYCSAGMAILPTLEIGQYIFCNADCAAKRIAELEAKLRAWEETAEYYCAADTPISADGVRGYIAELNAKLAAAKL